MGMEHGQERTNFRTTIEPEKVEKRDTVIAGTQAAVHCSGLRVDTSHTGEDGLMLPLWECFLICETGMIVVSDSGGSDEE